MRFFLTGHTGFVGCHLMRRLLADGHAVFTDLRDFEKKYDAVIHLAARTHINSEFDPELFRTNIIFAQKIMQTPNRLIYATSCSAAYMTNPYAYTKRYNEFLGEQHGNALGLRFHNIYGPNNNKGIVKFLIEQDNKAKVTIRGPELIRDYIHVEDVVNFISDLLRTDHTGVIDVGTGIGTKTIDLVNLFQEISGKRFILDFAEHGRGEPKTMISNYVVASRSLINGLKDVINAV